jgi:hypothetical protein
MSTETAAGSVTIYALTDPDSGSEMTSALVISEVRYVGRTANTEEPDAR